MSKIAKATVWIERKVSYCTEIRNVEVLLSDEASKEDIERALLEKATQIAKILSESAWDVTNIQYWINEWEIES